jgi:hypothetical protein
LSMCGPRGCWSSVPCTAGSSDNALSTGTGSAVVMPAGSVGCRDSIPGALCAWSARWRMPDRSPGARGGPIAGGRGAAHRGRMRSLRAARGVGGRGCERAVRRSESNSEADTRSPAAETARRRRGWCGRDFPIAAPAEKVQVRRDLTWTLGQLLPTRPMPVPVSAR